MSKDNDRFKGVRVYTVQSRELDHETETLIAVNKEKLDTEIHVLAAGDDYYPVNRTEDTFQPLLFQWLFLKSTEPHDSPVHEVLLAVEYYLSSLKLHTEEELLKGRANWSKSMAEAYKQYERSVDLFDRQVETLKMMGSKKQSKNAKLNTFNNTEVDTLLKPVFDEYLYRTQATNRKPTKSGFAMYLKLLESHERPRIGNREIGRESAIESFGRMYFFKES